MKNIYLFTVYFCCFVSFATFAQQLNISYLGRLEFQLASGTRLSNIGGYVDASGNEYALVGHPDGLSIVDVTDPTNPFQIFMVPSPNPGAPGNLNNWREVKTMGNYAYVVSEAGGGLQIMNLSDLPNSYQEKTWMGDGAIAGLLDRSHALHVDDNHVFIYGATSLANGGIIIANISDPWNPVYAGMYDDHYVHDGYVRADTVYAAQIYDGTIAIIDVTNKSNPQLVTTFATPTAFPHNTWLSDDSNTLFTTDENTASFLASYDITDVTNISELDRIQSYAGNGSIVHNTHILNDFAVNSWYHDGITIVDASRPANLIETGYYDLSPLTGSGFGGVWGVYPYLPSGNLIVTQRDSGLFILSPTYVRGAYLEGNVTDSLTGAPLSNVFVEILSTPASDITAIDGEYKTGLSYPGTFTIKFSRSGYSDKIISNVFLDNGVLTVVNVQLVPAISSITENVNGIKLNVYPNPASNELYIEGKNVLIHEFVLRDVRGRIILNQFVNDKLKNVYKIEFNKNLPSGFYILQSITEAGVISSKISLQKR